MLPTVGELSVAVAPSASHAAVTPAEFTPFQVLLVVCLMLLILRHGFALDAFVNIMVGSRTNGSKSPPADSVSDSARRDSPSGSRRYASNVSRYSSEQIGRASCRERV